MNASNVILRSSPGTSSKKITTLAKYTQFVRLEKSVKYVNGYYWDKVKLSNGTIGYIASKYVSSGTPSSSSSTSTSSSGSQTAKTTTSVYVRSSASTSGKRITTLKKGVTVTILQRRIAYKNGYYWDKVRLANGKTGYIASKYLK